MQENRRHLRYELDAVLICDLELEGLPRMHCLIRNLSITGALLECPANNWPGDIEPGDGCQLDDGAPESSRLMRSLPGRVVRTYRRFIGVEFLTVLLPSTRDLELWLMRHGLLDAQPAATEKLPAS